MTLGTRFLLLFLVGGARFSTATDSSSSIRSNSMTGAGFGSSTCRQCHSSSTAFQSSPRSRVSSATASKTWVDGRTSGSKCNNNNNIQQWPSPCFNVSQSTEDNYKLQFPKDSEDKTDTTVGSRTTIPTSTITTAMEAVLNTSRFAQIRKLLDYSYHSVYTIERQAFQDTLIQSMLDHHPEEVLGGTDTTTTTPKDITVATPNKSLPQPPGASSDHDATTSTTTTTNSSTTPQWIVFTAGVMGAGKTYTLEWLHRQAYFPLHDYVVVDPDHIRRSLPEFHQYLVGGEKQQQRSPSLHEQHPAAQLPRPARTSSSSISTTTSMAGEWTRKEANTMTEILTLAALQQGRCVVVDGSLRDAVWYQTYFSRLRKTFPGLSIAILHVAAPPQAVYQRAQNRAKVTGRVIPPALLQSVMQQVPASVQILRHQVDLFVELYNGPDSPPPQLVTPPNLTWEQFSRLWKTHKSDDNDRNLQHGHGHPCNQNSRL